MAKPKELCLSTQKVSFPERSVFIRLLQHFVFCANTQATQKSQRAVPAPHPVLTMQSILTKQKKEILKIIA
jgi:hypothetical protein